MHFLNKIINSPMVRQEEEYKKTNTRKKGLTKENSSS